MDRGEREEQRTNHLGENGAARLQAIKDEIATFIVFKSHLENTKFCTKDCECHEEIT